MRQKTFIGIALMSYTMASMAGLETESDELSYSLGARLAEQVKMVENISPNALFEGILDVLTNKELQLSKDTIQKNIEFSKRVMV